MNQIHIYSLGLLSCSVCVPKDMSRKEIEKKVNESEPTVIRSSWAISEEKSFGAGQSMPCVCEHDKARLHYLLHC